VQLGIDAMCVDRRFDQLTCRISYRPRRHVNERIAQQLHDLLLVTVDQRRDQRLLARKILIQRPDADAGDIRNPVGARTVVAILYKNASGRSEQRIDGNP